MNNPVCPQAIYAYRSLIAPKYLNITYRILLRNFWLLILLRNYRQISQVKALKFCQMKQCRVFWTQFCHFSKFYQIHRIQYMLVTHAVVLLCLHLHVVGLRLFSHLKVINLTHRFISTTAASVLESLNRPKYTEIKSYNEKLIRPWSIIL